MSKDSKERELYILKESGKTVNLVTRPLVEKVKIKHIWKGSIFNGNPLIEVAYLNDKGEEIGSNKIPLSEFCTRYEATLLPVEATESPLENIK